MEEIEKFWENIERLIREKDKTILQGKVTAVNAAERTCTLQVGGVAYEDVRLYGVVNAELKGWVMIPAIGSTVLAGRLGESNELFVVMFTQVDQVMYTVEEVSLTADSKGCHFVAKDSKLDLTPNGMTFTRSDSGLKKTLSDLCDALAKLTVTTGVGPSGIPINVADFTKIKTDLDKYLEG